MMRLLKLGKKQKNLAIITLAVIAVFLIDRIILSGLRNKLKNMRQQIKLAEVTLRRNLAIQNSKDNLLADYNNYQSYLKAEPADDNQILAEFLREIEHLAKETGVSVVNLNPQGVPEKIKDVKKYKADLQVEASLEQLLNFLYEIGRSKLLIKLDRVSLMPKDEGAAVLKMEASINRMVP